MRSNFAQYVLSIDDSRIVARLSTSWPDAATVVTQPAVRRAVGMPHTPKRVVVPASSPAYAVLSALAHDGIAHTAKFAEQAEQRAIDKANRKLVETLRAELLKK